MTHVRMLVLLMRKVTQRRRQPYTAIVMVVLASIKPDQTCICILGRKMANAARAKGTRAESQVTDYLKEKGFMAFRNPLSGANDKGDINLPLNPVTIEVKNHAKADLAGWVNEAEKESRNAGTIAGVAWFKKRGTQNPGEWYVVAKGSEFIKLLALITGKPGETPV